MAKERSTPRYIKIAQDVCGKILTGEYPEGTLLKGRSILGAAYGVSPETVRKALNILEKEKVVSSKRGVGVYIDSVLHAQEFANKWRAETQIKDKYATLEKLLIEQKELQTKINNAIDDMKDSFTYQTTEAVKFSQVEVPQNSWINGKTVGEVYFWNYTEQPSLLSSAATTSQSSLSVRISFSILETESSLSEKTTSHSTEFFHSSPTVSSTRVRNNLYF